MSTNPIRRGIRTGATFAVIIVFLALVGFTDTGANLIAKILGQAPEASPTHPHNFSHSPHGSDRIMEWQHRGKNRSIYK